MTDGFNQAVRALAWGIKALLWTVAALALALLILVAFVAYTAFS